MNWSVDNFRRRTAPGCLAAAVLLAGCDGGLGTAEADLQANPGAQGQDAGMTSTGAAGGSGEASYASTGVGGPVDTSVWALAPPFYAAGDEPYWRLDLVEDWFVFRRAGLPEIEAPIVQPERVRGADLFESPPLSVNVRSGACRSDAGVDGDAVVTVTFDGVDFSGCAFKGQSEAISADVGAIIEALPVVDACLRRFGQPAVITGAYPRDGGRMAVTLRARNGGLFECAAESQSGEVAFLDPVEPGAAGPWMTTQIRFLRSDLVPRPACADAEEVRAGETVVGLLLPAKCRF